MYRYTTTLLADVGCSPDGMDDCFSGSGSCWILDRACDLSDASFGDESRTRFERPFQPAALESEPLSALLDDVGQERKCLGLPWKHGCNKESSCYCACQVL